MAAFAFILGLIVIGGSWYIVGPTERGVEVTMGHMSSEAITPGFGLKMPIVSSVRMVNVQQSTAELQASCFSSDLQAITIKVKVLFRIPESSVVAVTRDYAGDPFDTLVTPRIQEAVKEVTALRTAADIVQSREKVKTESLEASRLKIGSIINVDDLVIEDVSLSPELEAAIEAKMVQQQNAEKAVFTKQQAQTDADTLVIGANAQAESIKIQGAALQSNPALVSLKWVEKWDGHVPVYVGGGSNPLMTLPVVQGETPK